MSGKELGIEFLGLILNNAILAIGYFLAFEMVNPSSDSDVGGMQILLAFIVFLVLGGFVHGLLSNQIQVALVMQGLLLASITRYLLKN